MEDDIIAKASNPDMSLILEADTILGMGQLWLGNLKGARNVKLLKSNKIQMVISVINKIDLSYHVNDAITHYHFDAPDIPSYEIYTIFPETNVLIAQGLKKGGVLIHCFAGLSRSATVTLAYLIMSRSWCYEQSIHYVKQRRFVRPNLGFAQQLITYCTEIQQKNISNKPSPRKGHLSLRKDLLSPREKQQQNELMLKLERNKDDNINIVKNLDLQRKKDLPVFITGAQLIQNRQNTDNKISQTKPQQRTTNNSSKKGIRQSIGSRTSRENSLSKLGKSQDLVLSKVIESDDDDSPSIATFYAKSVQQSFSNINENNESFFQARKNNVLNRYTSDPKLQAYYSPVPNDDCSQFVLTQRNKIEFAKRAKAHFATASSFRDCNGDFHNSCIGQNREYIQKRIQQIGLLNPEEMKLLKTTIHPKKNSDSSIKKHNAAVLYKTEYKF